MTLTIHSAMFEDVSLGAHAARSADGQAFSIRFDALAAHSGGALDGASMVRGEGTIQCRGCGWVALSVRGALAAAGSHAFAHLLGRVNGRPFEAACAGADEPFDTSVVAAVDGSGRVRVSLLLIAQADPAPDRPAAQAAADCRVDTIDVVVLEPHATARQHPQEEAR